MTIANELNRALNDTLGSPPACYLCSTAAIYEVTTIAGHHLLLCPNHDLNHMELFSCVIIGIDTSSYQFPIRDADYLARRSERRQRYGRCEHCGR